MSEGFCPKCGATGKPRYKEFCIDCYLKDHPKIVSAESSAFKQCPKCLRVFFRGKWHVGSKENVEGFLASKIKTSLDNPKFSFSLARENVGELEYEAEVEGFIGGNRVLVSLPLSVKLEKNTCEVCSRKYGNYYEALVQLRPQSAQADLERIKSAFVFMRNEIRSLVKKDRNAEIFRFEKVRNGINIYFGSARAAKIVLRHMQATYHPVVKESYTLRGVNRETGKKRYSITYSVRL